jgi:hypothetical protein
MNAEPSTVDSRSLHGGSELSEEDPSAASRKGLSIALRKPRRLWPDPKRNPRQPDGGLRRQINGVESSGRPPLSTAAVGEEPGDPQAEQLHAPRLGDHL